MFTQPPVVTVLSIPELLEPIRRYLSTPDLVRCSAVSKVFSNIFTPILWHAVSLRTQVQHHRFTESPEVQAALARNSGYIRVIIVQTCKSLGPFLNIDADHLKNIHTLHVLKPIEAKTEILNTNTDDSTDNDAIQDDSTDNDTIQDDKLWGYKDMPPVKVTDWLQERNVFLMYHGVAVRMHMYQQAQMGLSRQQLLLAISQTISQAQGQIEISRNVLKKPLGLSESSAEEKSILKVVKSHRNKIQRYITRMTLSREHTPTNRINKKFQELYRNLKEVWSELDDQCIWLVQKLEGKSQLSYPPTPQLRALQLEHQQQQNVQQPSSSNPIHQQVRSPPLPVLEQQQQQQSAQGTHEYETQRVVISLMELQQQMEQLQRLRIWMISSSSLIGSVSAGSLNISSWDHDRDEDWRLLQQFLMHVPGIRVFSINKPPATNGEIIKALMENVKQSGLESLSLDYCDFLLQTCNGYLKHLGHFLDNCPPQLECLRVSGAINPLSSDNTKDLLDARPNTGGPMNTRIKELLLEGNLALHIRPLFLSQCPELRSLSLAICSEEILKIATRCIGEHCPLLEELAVAIFISDINLNILVDLLEACSNIEPRSSSEPSSSTSPSLNQKSPSHGNQTLTKRVGLKKLMFSGFNFSQQRDFVTDALCRLHSSTLTHLAIRSCRGAFSDHSVQGDAPIQKILTSFRELEFIDFTFSAFSPTHWTQTNQVDASSFVKCGMTWPFATTLRVLRIIINGIPRSHVHPDAHGIETQVNVCQSLGSLTSLEELALGVDVDDGPLAGTYPKWGYQTSCLELTLETGLCFMDELKRLRKFKVTRMDHRIRLKELRWMCESWPALREIGGLLRYRIGVVSKLEVDMDNEIEDWIKETNPQLRYK